MDFEEITGSLKDAVTVRQVFGDPYQVDGVTLIPVARGGGGGGSGEGEGPPDQGGGRGGGGGFGIRPVGVYVVKDGEVTFVPTVDPVALAGKAAVVAVAGLMAWRSVARARHRRKARQAKYAG